MESFERYVRQVKRLNEEVRVGSVEGFDFKGLLDKLRNPAESKLHKAVALGLFLKRAFPFLDKGYEYHTEEMPFSPKDYEFKGKIGGGGESDVYLLESKKSDRTSVVIKINLHSGLQAGELIQLAQDIKRESEEIKSWYEDMSDTIPKENYLIMEGIRDSGPALVSVQEYFGRNLKDLLWDTEAEEIIDHAKQDDRFKQELLNFIRITLQKEEAENISIDLLGKKNVSVVEDEDGKWRLVLLDMHSPHKSDEIKESHKIRKSQCLDKLRHIESELI